MFHLTCTSQVRGLMLTAVRDLPEVMQLVRCVQICWHTNLAFSARLATSSGHHTSTWSRELTKDISSHVAGNTL